MTAVRLILLGTLIFTATFVKEVVAEGISNLDNSAQTAAFDRFRPGSSYSATGKGTATGPSSRYQASRQHAGQQNQLRGLPNQATTIVQHDRKPSLPNELRIASETFQKVEDAKTTLPDFEPREQPASFSVKAISSEPARLQAKPPVEPLAKPTVDPLVEKLSQALATEPIKSLESAAIDIKSAEKESVVVQAGAQSSVEVSEAQSNETQLNVAETTDDSDTRKLGFSSAAISSTGKQADSPFNELLAWRPSSNSLVTMGSGLAIVLGLVMVAGWIARKSMPRSARVLPSEVAEVLGRVVLSSRQTAQLLKLGNKLILVSVTADGAETLTEIEDPAEVQRLLQLSEEASGRGSNAEFERVFQQLANGQAADGFLGDEAPDYDDPRYDQDPRHQNPDNVHYDAQRLAAAYANTPGGRSHAA